MRISEIRNIDGAHHWNNDEGWDDPNGLGKPMVGSFTTLTELVSGVDLREVKTRYPDERVFEFIQGDLSIGDASLLDHKINTQYGYIEGYIVGGITIKKSMRRQGIGYAFYTYALDHIGVLFSDENQTSLSRAVWRKLAKEHTVRAYNTRTQILGKPIKDTREAYRSPRDSDSLDHKILVATT